MKVLSEVQNVLKTVLKIRYKQFLFCGYYFPTYDLNLNKLAKSITLDFLGVNFRR